MEHDLVRRARDFAISAHRRIDQRRKYTSQPYEAHLRAVAKLVQDVTDDPETVAAAWLHDTVEDTEATFEDLGREFGPGVEALVEALTDVSRPGDGNRARRKAIDREHLAAAPPRAKTVKLADLVDNARDVTRHDASFARVFLEEARLLLEVLREGDRRLAELLERELERASARLEPEEPLAPPGDEAAASDWLRSHRTTATGASCGCSRRASRARTWPSRCAPSTRTRTRPRWRACSPSTSRPWPASARPGA